MLVRILQLQVQTMLKIASIAVQEATQIRLPLLRVQHVLLGHSQYSLVLQIVLHVSCAKLESTLHR